MVDSGIYKTVDHKEHFYWGRKPTVPYEQKISAVTKYLEGKKGKEQIAKEHKVNP